MGEPLAPAATISPLLPTWLQKLLGSPQNGAWGHFPDGTLSDTLSRPFWGEE